MGFLLDTNILSDLVRRPRGRIADRIAEVGEQHVCTSIIVAAELRCQESLGRSREAEQLRPMPHLAIDSSVRRWN